MGKILFYTICVLMLLTNSLTLRTEFKDNHQK